MEAAGGRLHVVVDNVSLEENLEPDWGFACLLTLPRGVVLFDTGAGATLLLNNMARMGLDARSIEHVVLSHVHDDHSGGLGGVLAESRACRVLVPASFPPQTEAYVEARGGTCERVREGRAILPGIHTTGEMGGDVPEQALVLESNRGLIVVTGCAHPGIVEVVTRVVRCFEAPSRLLLGGFHLMHHAPREVAEICRRLETLGVERIAPCHCTGETAKPLIHQHFGDRCRQVGVGFSARVA